MTFLVLSLALGFLVTFIGAPYAERYLLASGIFAIDQQKKDEPRLASSGGIVVLFGFLVSITSYLAFSAFFEIGNIDLAVTLAALNSAILISLIGLLDDIHLDLEAVIEEHISIGGDEVEVELHREGNIGPLPHQRFVDRVTGNFGSGEKQESGEVIRKGLGQIPKMLFVLPAALPLIAVGAGSWTMHFPLIGTVHWGALYPLVLLPIGLFFVSNVVNMLAGTNGLAAGMSFVASTALGVFGYINGSMEAALIAFSLSSCLLAFLYFNFYPASLLPGDSLTYLCGAAMFSAMVVGNMEKFGVFIFTPWIAEFFLKLRSGFQAHSWGVLQDDGSLESQHEKIYSLTHVFMRRGFNERQITLSLVGLETLICLAGIYLFTAVL
jgi:UDP-N-acetylmuramyl pentapeptide phosphotransferase/UDP-N-acetylglucosamine-1-phosphate transferase